MSPGPFGHEQHGGSRSLADLVSSRFQLSAAACAIARCGRLPSRREPRVARPSRRVLSANRKTPDLVVRCEDESPETAAERVVALLVEKGSLILGTWQRVILVELDGPRSREIAVGFVKTE